MKNYTHLNNGNDERINIFRLSDLKKTHTHFNVNNQDGPDMK